MMPRSYALDELYYCPACDRITTSSVQCACSNRLSLWCLARWIPELSDDSKRRVPAVSDSLPQIPRKDDAAV